MSDTRRVCELTVDQLIEALNTRRLPAVDVRPAATQRPITDTLRELSDRLDALLLTWCCHWEDQGSGASSQEVAEALATNQPTLNRLHKVKLGKARARYVIELKAWHWALPVPEEERQQS